MESVGIATSVWSFAPEFQISSKIAQSHEELPESPLQLTQTISRHWKCSTGTSGTLLLLQSNRHFCGLRRPAFLDITGFARPSKPHLGASSSSDLFPSALHLS